MLTDKMGLLKKDLDLVGHEVCENKYFMYQCKHQTVGYKIQHIHMKNMCQWKASETTKTCNVAIPDEVQRIINSRFH